MYDHCTAIDAVIDRGRVGDVPRRQRRGGSIMEVATILSALGKPESLKTIVPDRPGHDRRYVLDSSKLRSELGWAPSVEWEQGLGDTVAWYAANREWWEPLLARAPVAEGSWGGEGTERVRILITGANGQLGRDLLDCLAGRVPDGGRRCALLGPEGPRPGLTTRCWAPTSTPCGSTTGTPSCPRSLPSRTRPARRRVDRGRACETDVDEAYAVNAIGTRHIAEAAALVGAHVVCVSTDYVFDGTSDRPYREWDAAIRRRSTAPQAGW